MNTLTCPRCGAENNSDVMNCVECRINLKFALEHPSDVERIRQEDVTREQSNWSASANDFAEVSASHKQDLLKPVLLLLGSFVFAFCLGEAVHELGHYLVHSAYGVDVRIRLDPFGGSATLQNSAPREILGVTSIAGPLLNLIIGMTVSLLLWWNRKPFLLPLLLWSPVSLVQEGVTFSLGMLTPGGDAEFIVNGGVPAIVLISVGILFLAMGVTAICWLLPLVSLFPEDSFNRKFGVVAGGMVSFFVVRLFFSGLRSPSHLKENTVPLVFSIILATIVVWLYKPLCSILRNISNTEAAEIRWSVVLFSKALGIGMIVFQLIFFN